MRRSFLVLVTLVAVSGIASAADTITYRIENDISYLQEGQADATDYQRDRCRLDVYYPESKPGFATVVWFHGGGL